MAALNQVRPFRDGKRLTAFGAGAAAVGLALLLLAAASDPRQAAFSYLTAFAYVVSIQLGALIFLMIGHAAHAVWTIPARKLTESIASGLVIAPVLFVPILLAMRHLYSWAAGPLHGGEAVRFLPGKEAYLNVPFFALRAAIYFATWIAMIVALRRWSLAADRDGGAHDGARSTRLSAGGLPVLGLTLTFAAIDWLMSLEPEWFSSAYGIYYFAGSFVGALGLITVLAYLAERSGWLSGYVQSSHYHALGRLLLTFTIFWTYIAFFQLFLIYIANRPEEVTYYVRRIRGSWAGYGYVLLFGHFVLPFLLLLLRGIKFLPRWLASIAAFIVVIHYVDVYWLVMPVLHDQGFRPHYADLAALLFVAGVAVAVSVRLLHGQPIVPWNDPRLAEGIHYRST